MPTPTRRTAATAVLAVLGLTACGSGSESGSGSTQSDLTVVAGFYPLEFVTSRVAGDLASVDTLTAPGVDPHDVELSPRSVATVKEADLVVYSSGLQEAVDAAVQDVPGDQRVDVSTVADLVPLEDGDEHEHGGEHADSEGHEDEHGHEEEHENEDGHEHGLDPHFWLDPERMVSVTREVAERLGDADPEHASTYQANADSLVSDLDEVQAEYDEGLAQCQQDAMVTTHDAFGYIARAHDLEMIGIAGISPESEPSPARLAEVAEIVEDTGVTVVYTEVLLNPDIAETVASETGTQVRVLDPLEGLTEDSPGADYLSVMRSNLQTLQRGQECS